MDSTGDVSSTPSVYPQLRHRAELAVSPRPVLLRTELPKRTDAWWRNIETGAS